MPKNKILFTFYALPPYLVSLLNKIGHVYEVIVVIPSETSEITKGKSVFESEEKALFQIIKTKERETIIGKPYFPDLYQIVKKTQPQVIVTCWPYILNMILDFKLVIFTKQNRIPIGYKSIPYQIPKYNEAMQFYSKIGITNENGKTIKANSLKNRIKFWFLKEINKICFRFADFHLNYISDSYKILGSYGVTKEKIFVTHNSGDTDELQEAYDNALKEQKILPEGKFRFIFVGRLVKWKNTDMLLRQFASISSNYETEFIIVGGGPELPNLKQLADELKISNRVLFTNAIHDIHQLARYFVSSDVFVLGGAGGLAINDAMTFGKAVLCGKADGTENDLVIDGETGFIAKNFDDFQKYMVYFLENPQEAKRMGNNARKLIVEKINIDTVSCEYIKCFDTVIKSNQKCQMMH